MASATMTATGDNFFNAFAVYLNATSAQMGLLTAVPQLFGALFQLASVWLCSYISRRHLIVVAACLQALVVAGIGSLAISQAPNAIFWLIGLAVLYFSLHNSIQPQWRAWMGSIVPGRRRGAFFAARTRLTMVASLLIFIGGGALLTASTGIGATWLGFAVLFIAAGCGRAMSGYYLWRMQTPTRPRTQALPGTWAAALLSCASRCMTRPSGTTVFLSLACKAWWRQRPFLPCICCGICSSPTSNTA